MRFMPAPLRILLTVLTTMPALISALILALMPDPAMAAGKVALVIGNAAYSGVDALRTPANDARDMKAVLEGFDFEVIEAIDADLAGMKAAVERFGEALGAGGIGLFYYSGHGLQFGQRNYLLPVDVDRARLFDENVPDEVLKRMFLSVDEVMETLTEKERDFNLVILDACNDTGVETRGGRALGSLAQTQTPSGVMLAFAAGIGQLASAGWGRNSVYTDALLKHLKMPELRVQDILPKVREHVAWISGERQIPFEANTVIKRDFYLTRQWYSTLHRFRDCAGCPEMVVIPSGSYVRGSHEGRSDEQPLREVKVERRFAMAAHEVTFEQWEACVADREANRRCRYVPDDQGMGRGKRPVINVSWADARDYVGWLSETTGQRYRLPSEAEWEYAARAGSSGAYPWGNAPNSGRATVGTVASTPVGQHEPNAFGLYDIVGNVFEWTEDCYGDYANAPTNGSAWRHAACNFMVVRGGAWSYGIQSARVSFRGRNPPHTTREDVGFRVARLIDD